MDLAVCRSEVSNQEYVNVTRSLSCTVRAPCRHGAVGSVRKGDCARRESSTSTNLLLVFHCKYAQALIRDLVGDTYARAIRASKLDSHFIRLVLSG